MHPSATLCPACISLKENSDSDETSNPQKPLEPVLLNVYDMYKFNDYTSNIGLGIFHSGVEVYGVEYAYGGHQYAQTGIFEMNPRDELSLGEFFSIKGHLKFKQTILIGHTNYTPEEVERIKIRMGKKFRGNNYHLIHNNCNHFSGSFTKILCKKSIPGWVNRLAHLGSYVPFLHKMLPQQWIGPASSSQNVIT